MLLKFIIIVYFGLKTSFSSKCDVELPSSVPKYNLIEKCHRSKLGIAAKANFTSLISCQRLGIQKKALALSFSPPTVTNGSDPLEYTCEVLICAEAEGGLSLTNDTRYDYYSLYGNPLPYISSTCVPATGMFLLLPRKLNYTQAQRRCRSIKGVLTDVASEQRTDALAQVLASAGVEAAYVGMWSRRNNAFYNSNGNALDCSTYRAWAPGYPRQRSNVTCVVLTRHRTWKTNTCRARLHALCELLPGGPYKKGSIFPSKLENATTQATTDYSDY